MQVQLHADMFTLSALPSAHWKTVLSLDVIKKRNKPVAPPKAPKAAPFFLPTLPGVQRVFDPTPLEDDEVCPAPEVTPAATPAAYRYLPLPTMTYHYLPLPTVAYRYLP